MSFTTWDSSFLKTVIILACLVSSFYHQHQRYCIKLNTVTIRGCDTNSLFTLFWEIPILDWKHMLSQENGQLLLDIGISYHPDPGDNQSLIGLWSSTPSMHHMSRQKWTSFRNSRLALCPDMVDYRGWWKAVTGGLFNSLLNLHTTSSLRPSYDRLGQKEKFCSDLEAYANTAVFQQTYHDFVTQYQGAKRRSFGVREEVRASGFAIINALRSAWHKVCF